jgi:hypothetical protein
LVSTSYIKYAVCLVKHFKIYLAHKYNHIWKFHFLS